MTANSCGHQLLALGKFFLAIFKDIFGNPLVSILTCGQFKFCLVLHATQALWLYCQIYDYVVDVQFCYHNWFFGFVICIYWIFIVDLSTYFKSKFHHWTIKHLSCKRII